MKRRPVASDADAGGNDSITQSDSDLQTKQSDSSPTASDGQSGPQSGPRKLTIELSMLQMNILLACSVVLVLAIAVGIGVWFQDNRPLHWSSHPDDFRELGPEVLALFRQHDTNDNGALELREFEPLAHVLIDVSISLTYDLPITPEDNVVTLGSHFQPLDLKTMQSVENNQFNWDSAELSPLSALRRWTKPVMELQNFAIQYFSIFLPKKTGPVLGEAYHITPYGSQSEDDIIHMKNVLLSSNRYHPPRITGDLIILHNLLAMLHDSPFINTRFSPQGSLACVRAYNGEWWDISFRVHAEFQLQEPPRQPFWFTPAQFKGRLVISKDMTRIKYFRMYVPNNRRLNVDMEWLKNDAEHSMEVDIGYMEQMELRSTGPSRPATYNGYDLRTSLKPETEPYEPGLQDITWTKEVQVDVCERAMDLVFYPFKTVPYLNYTEVHEAARSENKLVHLIALWGALDDQSC